MISQLCVMGVALGGGGLRGGFGFGRRSVESGMILETADALNLAVLNTWFVQGVGRA